MAVETDTLREILAMVEDEKYVTWKQLISTVLVALSLGMGLAGWECSGAVAAILGRSRALIKQRPHCTLITA